MTAIKRVLITGAAGAIGRTLRAAWRGRYAMRLLDVVPPEPAGADEETIVADCADQQAMIAAAQGMDAIVHLAVDPKTRAAPERAWALIGATWTVFEAARIAGARRFVFASSNHAGGMAAMDEALASGVTPRPDSLYGICKVAGEAMARHHVDKHGLTALCLRIGSFKPVPVQIRDLKTWLSPGDMARLAECGLTQNALRFAVVYGFSNNTRLPRRDPLWETIGYRPQDDAERFAATIAAAPGDPWIDGKPPLGAWFAERDWDVKA